MNTQNYKVYVGQAVHYRKSGCYLVKHGYIDRFREHIHTALSGRRDCPKLYNAISKYGRDSFYTRRLAVCSEEDVDDVEIWWIKIFNAVKSGYNSVAGGRHSKPSDALIGAWKNPSYRQHQSEVHKETWKTEEYRTNYNNAINNRVRENGLPRNIYIAKKNGVHVGYEVTIKHNSENYRKMFANSRIPMEDKLILAINWKNETLSKLK